MALRLAGPIPRRWQPLMRRNMAREGAPTGTGVALSTCPPAQHGRLTGRRLACLSALAALRPHRLAPAVPDPPGAGGLGFYEAMLEQLFYNANITGGGSRPRPLRPCDMPALPKDIRLRDLRDRLLHEPELDAAGGGSPPDLSDRAVALRALPCLPAAWRAFVLQPSVPPAAFYVSEDGCLVFFFFFNCWTCLEGVVTGPGATDVPHQPH